MNIKEKFDMLIKKLQVRGEFDYQLYKELYGYISLFELITQGSKKMTENSLIIKLPYSEYQKKEIAEWIKKGVNLKK